MLQIGELGISILFSIEALENLEADDCMDAGGRTPPGACVECVLARKGKAHEHSEFSSNEE